MTIAFPFPCACSPSRMTTCSFTFASARKTPAAFLYPRRCKYRRTTRSSAADDAWSSSACAAELSFATALVIERPENRTSEDDRCDALKRRGGPWRSRARSLTRTNGRSFGSRRFARSTGNRRRGTSWRVVNQNARASAHARWSTSTERCERSTTGAALRVAPRAGDVAMEIIAHALVYTGGYAFLVFMAVCLATGARAIDIDARAIGSRRARRMNVRETNERPSANAKAKAKARTLTTTRRNARARGAGLYYLAEMVEEYTRLTKKVLDWAIKITLVAHVLLLIVDRMPFMALVVSGGSQFAYARMLKRFPFIEFASVDFIASLAALAATHWVWIRHFHMTYHSTEYVLGFFFMVVWFVPFGFFISIAANESVLPGGAAVPGAPPTAGGLGGYDQRAGKKSRNVMLQVLDFLKMQWKKVAEKMLPAGGIPGTYRDPGYNKGW